MKLFYKACLIGFMFLLTACGSIQYITGRDVPQKPAFTVVTTYGTTKDLGYASKVELLLIDMGLSVVTPPARIKTEKTTGGGAAVESLDHTAQIEVGAFTAKVVQQYSFFDQTKADYIVIVDSINNTIKLIHKETKEVLLVLTEISDPTFHKERIRKAFTAAGFTVRGKN
ncbi:hypothetical protein M2G59_21320 [Vibrio vulnificus]|uniref:hypothetical protein n=1 Tax=Vibrio vulnificus TaxID=672 RepID=UPI0005003D87|nr:hypothetical protein [Vibrio vulnificus]ASJ38422.1 hypothetical protein VVCECT4999_06870 [Vibrio vulnificus]EGR0394905.1 hypothetical protein [Vibrio vulnificus]EGR0642279.1 hypothetical protein [Vibrio vulnificus]EGR0651493.1 hypothetical protein [Vibrio vulnificus]EHH0804842.1 hypothetical protein [Vibrio vulnificus]